MARECPRGRSRDRCTGPKRTRISRLTMMPRAAPTPGVPRSPADTLEDSNRRQDESNRRILEASAGYLTAAQQEALKTRYEQQAAQRRRTVEFAREMDARMPVVPTPPAPQ